MSDKATLIEELRALERQALEAVSQATGEDGLEEIRITYLGRKDGKVSLILRKLGGLGGDDRPAVGAEANRVKTVIQEALEERTGALASSRPEAGPGEDLTLPARSRWVGARHPVTQVIDEICEIFKGMGFTRARGPEADSEWYNFVALNTPLDHPAADEQDTLYLKDSVLLRSHTSPVQIRTMENHQPPIRILAPGMVYRRDTYDATHAPAFAQIEGLVVDEGITFVDFKATLEEFARHPGALSTVVLSVHRAQCGGGREAGDRRARRLSPRDRLAGDHGRGNGGSGGPGKCRIRFGALHRIRLRHGARKDRNAQVRDHGHPGVLRERRPFPQPIRIVQWTSHIAGSRTLPQAFL
jgi:phenylalanyl-tRNA synthetase alpha subunit